MTSTVLTLWAEDGENYIDWEIIIKYKEVLEPVKLLEGWHRKRERERNDDAR